MQCCVERSQSLRNVSLEEVMMKPGLVDVDVEGKLNAILEMKRMAVIWSLCPRSLDSIDQI